MTDDREDPAGPAPEPPAPPAEPSPVRARRRPWGWIVAALLGVTLIVLVILYFMGMFEGERHREEVPWNTGTEAPAGDPILTSPPPAARGQVTAEWLQGAWGNDCPAARTDALEFRPGGAFLGGTEPGRWTLAGDIVTVQVGGRPASMRWEYLSQDSARVTLTRSGRVNYVYRCPPAG